MSLTHPPSFPSPTSTHPVIGYYKDSVSGEVSKWQFPRVQLFAVPADIPGRDVLFRRIEILLKQIVSRIIRTYRGSRCGKRLPHLWISYNLAPSPQSLKMYELRSPFSETNIVRGRCISIVSPLSFDILFIFFFFLYIARCDSRSARRRSELHVSQQTDPRFVITSLMKSSDIQRE